MSIDSPSLSLDILGAKNDVHATNCVLRENQTKLLGRGSLDYILSVRNETLRNKGYRVPEDWDHSWTKSLGPIWTPESIGLHLETWLSPEYYKPDSADPTVCGAITNRADNSATPSEWVQSTLASMPVFEKDTSVRNHEGLNFDGVRTNMRAPSAAEWYMLDQDFIIAVVVTPLDSNTSAPIVSKKNNANFSLHYDSTGSNKSYVFYMNSVALSAIRPSLTGTAANLVVCGRISGKAFLSVLGTFTEAASADTTSFSDSQKPWLGDQAANAAEYLGRIHEVVVVNDNMTSGTNVITMVLIEQIEGYLANKYNLVSGLPSTHTYKDSPPRASIRKES